MRLKLSVFAIFCLFDDLFLLIFFVEIKNVDVKDKRHDECVSDINKEQISDQIRLIIVNIRINKKHKGNKRRIDKLHPLL